MICLNSSTLELELTPSNSQFIYLFYLVILGSYFFFFFDTGGKRIISFYFSLIILTKIDF